MSYVESTQLKNWMFSDQQLNEFRSKCNQLQRDVIMEKAPNSESNILTPNEEVALVRYYERKVSEIGAVLKLPEKVFSTASIYMKRFFLNNSIMRFNPKLIMFSCIYIACKTEDNHLDIDYYSTLTKIPPTDVTDLEMVILESLKFNLIVYHPFRALQGYINDINENIQLYGSGTNTNSLLESCKPLIQRSLFTDLCFEFHPPIIALASLSLNWDNFNLYIENKFKDNGLEFINNMLSKVEKVKSVLVATLDKSDLEHVKLIDRKLIFLNNPEKEKRKPKKDSNKAPKKKVKSTTTPPTNDTPPQQQQPTLTTTTTTTTTTNTTAVVVESNVVANSTSVRSVEIVDYEMVSSETVNNPTDTTMTNLE